MKLTPDQQALLEAELPEFKSLLAQITKSAKELSSQTSSFLKKTKQEKLEKDDSVSYLEVKQQVLLQYCISVCYYIYLKVSGCAIDGHPVLKQLLELRVIMEKCRPLDRKLKYQIDKLLKLAEDGGAGGAGAGGEDADPLSFRPNVGALVPKAGAGGGGGDGDGDEEAEGAAAGAEGGGRAGGSDGIYRAPRISAMPYTEGDNADDVEEKRQKRIKEKLRRSEILASLQETYGDRPERAEGVGAGGGALGAGGGVTAGVDSARLRRLRREEAERTKWEEDRFTRARLTKKEKKKRQAAGRQATQLSALAEIGKFATFDDLSRSGGRDDSFEGTKKRRRSGGAGGGGGSNFKKKKGGGAGGKKRR